MNAQGLEQLRRRMGEAAVLPHDDPERQAVVREISAVDGPLEQEWLDLLREDERMRLELARVDPPHGLEERLLAIARRDPQRQRFWALRLPRWLGALAALLIIGLGVWWGVGAVKGHRQKAALHDFASLAMAGHESGPELTIAASEWHALETALKDKVPFEIQRPTLDQSLRFLGGKATTLGGNHVLYTRWQAGGKSYSLYQFCAKDFGLRSPLERRTVTPEVSGGGGRCQVTVWTEGHCDYALVVEQGDSRADAPSAA